MMAHRIEMRDWRSQARRLCGCVLLLGLAISSAGCNIRPRGVYQVGNWGPATFLENGVRVTLYTKQIEEYRGPLLWYDSNLSRESEIMTEQPTVWTKSDFDHTDARRLWPTAPPWRREEVIKAAVKCLTAGGQGLHLATSSG